MRLSINFNRFPAVRGRGDSTRCSYDGSLNACSCDGIARLIISRNRLTLVCVTRYTVQDSAEEHRDCLLLPFRHSAARTLVPVTAHDAIGAPAFSSEDSLEDR